MPEGLNPSSLAKRIPLTTALAAALNTNTTCTRYIPSYGQCGGSAGGCYGADCLVRTLLIPTLQTLGRPDRTLADRLGRMLTDLEGSQLAATMALCR